MRHRLLILLIFCCIRAGAQNIVPNPSFAEYTVCPFSLAEMARAVGWMSASSATPDYFNQCNNAGNVHVGVPLNFIGNQPSASKSYAGIVIYADLMPNTKEYFSRPIPALIVGEEYKVTMFVSLADRSLFISDGLGIFFYNDSTPYSKVTMNTLAAIPQVDYTSYGLINDTVNWIPLTDTLVADSAYTHIVIGCFKDEADMTIQQLPPLPPPEIRQPFAYYYIDSVAIERIVPASITNLGHAAPQKLKIFPNPASGIVHITTQAASGKIRLLNAVGAQVWEKDVTTTRTSFDTQMLPKGIYIAVWEHDGSTERQRVVVK